MEIITIRRHHSGEAADPYGGSPDAEFMRHCREVDLNPPATWDAYDLSTEAGARKVIEMDYKDLMAAKAPAETREIYHLAVALLRYWRLHQDDHTTKHTGD